MKKFWSIFTVALVALSAVSCSNNFEEEVVLGGETLSFNVNIDNTRTALEQGENGWNTVWVGNETLVVSDDTNSYSFKNSAENKNKFTCEAVGVRSLIGKKVDVVYNAVINSANGAAGMTLKGEAENFSESVAIELAADNAFLKLTSTADVTLTASENIFGDGSARQNSVTLKGENVLVPVYAAENVTLSAAIAGETVKEKALTFVNNKIYNLGTIEEKTAPAEFMSAFNSVSYFLEPAAVGTQNIFVLAVADAVGNEAEFYFYNETPYLDGEYNVISMDQMGSVSAGLIGGDDVSSVTFNGVKYNVVGGMLMVQTMMPDMDYNLVNFQLELEDVNGNKAVITQGGESLMTAFGYTGGSSTTPLSLKVWGFTKYDATVDGTTVTLTSVSLSGKFVMVLSGVQDGNIAAADNFYTVSDGNLSGYYDDTFEGRFDFTSGGIWFEKMEGENNYQLFISPMSEWKIGNKWHVDNGLEIGTGLDIVVNFPVTEPVATEYGVVGSFQGWDVAVGKPVTMYEAKDGWCVARGVELYKSDEFKIVKGNSWDVNYGLASAGILALDKEIAVVTSNSQNMKAAKNGKFDISLNATTKKIKYTCVEEYTGTVDIKINNKANWSPLYITLKKGASVIADKQLVTDNKIAVDMNYIAEELSYTLSNGTKTKSGIVNIAKDGASITLEENVILLKVQLDTANSKQYWGNTMKIHAWNTGTSFDTNWPGNTMKAEGNYTWSIEVPSELVGKTIDFLVHNGNGWQCPDAKVTIKAEGNTITGSSIGIK